MGGDFDLRKADWVSEPAERCGCIFVVLIVPFLFLTLITIIWRIIHACGLRNEFMDHWFMLLQ
jgi:hypothetical protein